VISSSTFTSSPFNLIGGDHIRAKIVAVNAYGETVQSEEGNGAYYTTLPDKPINLIENLILRTATQNSLTWSSGAYDGGLAVIDYRINRKEGNGVYSEFASGITGTTFLTSGLVLGATYTWTVEARNAVGYSSVSDSLQILHALVPS
jgi:hypothetical protein